MSVKKIFKTASLLISVGLSICVFAQSQQQTTQQQASKQQPAPDVAQESKSWVQGVDSGKFAEKTTTAEEQGLADLRAIAGNIQALKSDVITLNKDLRKMEEKILFPSNTRYTVFLSLTTGQFFTLESVKLKIDGKLVSSHVYSQKQRSSLSRGGVHKLYVTNLNEGFHEVTAFFTGIGVDGRPYKRAANLEFEKSIGSEFLELAVVDNGATQEPEFSLKQW